MIDLTNPSPLVMTEFELLAAVAAFAAVAGMAAYDWLVRQRLKSRRASRGGAR